MKKIKIVALLFTPLYPTVYQMQHYIIICVFGYMRYILVSPQKSTDFIELTHLSPPFPLTLYLSFSLPPPTAIHSFKTVCVEYDRSCCHHWGFYSGHCLALHSILWLKCGFKIQCRALSHPLRSLGPVPICITFQCRICQISSKYSMPLTFC